MKIRPIKMCPVMSGLSTKRPITKRAVTIGLSTKRLTTSRLIKNPRIMSHCTLKSSQVQRAPNPTQLNTWHLLLPQFRTLTQRPWSHHIHRLPLNQRLSIMLRLLHPSLQSKAQQWLMHRSSLRS
jgi:hypothetical protein